MTRDYKRKEFSGEPLLEKQTNITYKTGGKLHSFINKEGLTDGDLKTIIYDGWLKSLSFEKDNIIKCDKIR